MLYTQYRAGLLGDLGDFLEGYTQKDRRTHSPSSWLAEEVVRLNCCSRYLPRKAAKPATTAISMQAARTMQVNTGFESRCFVTFGITAVRERKQSQGRIH